MNEEPNTLVLMAGLPASGKSTLAFELGRLLKWHVIDKDEYKEVLLQQRLDEEMASKISYDLAFNTAQNVLEKQQTSVILDSAALYSTILENARDIIHSIPNAQLKVILCIADQDLRHNRLRNRSNTNTIIRVDPATISEYLDLFQHLPPSPDTLTLYTFLPVEHCLEEAKNFLNPPDNKSESEDSALRLVGARRM